MINNDRIVPIQKCDFLSMIGIILTLNGDNPDILYALGAEGDYLPSSNGTYIADQPVKKLMIESAFSGEIYFVADYHFDGIYVNGVKHDEEVKADGITLYKFSVAEGSVNLTPITPIA